MGSHGCGSRLHHFLDRRRVCEVDPTWAHPAEHDAVLVGDNDAAFFQSGDIGQPVVGPAGRWIAIDGVERSPFRGVGAHGGQPGGHPVDLPGRVVVHRPNPRRSSLHAARGLMSHKASQQYTTTGRATSKSARALAASRRFSGRWSAPGRCSSVYSCSGSTSTRCAPASTRRRASSRSAIIGTCDLHPRRCRHEASTSASCATVGAPEAPCSPP
jgi:hypothetical protein